MKLKLDLDKWWMRLLLLVVLVFVIVDILVEKHHVTVDAEFVPGFYAAVGFFGTIFIVVFSKAIGKWLVREEDYYG